MKRMKLLFGILLVTFAVACGQKADDTFQKPIYFPQGIYIGTDPILHLTWSTGGQTVTWLTLTGKPAVFPPDLTVTNPLYKPIGYVPTWDELTGKPSLFSGSYIDLTNKPGEIELGIAISQMRGIIPPRYTTSQIEALVPTAAEEGLEVYDLTLHVKKYWNGTIWKILPTAN